MKTLESEFLEKIESHKGMIFKISKMYVDGKEDREDLFQEIIYQLWKSYQNFEGKSQFSTWLYRVSINTALTFLNKEKKKTRQRFFTRKSRTSRRRNSAKRNTNRFSLQSSS